MPEPAAVGPGEHQVSGVALPFRYPDGSHDSETLLVHPATGALFVLTKSWTKPSKLYEFPMPFTPDQPALLSERGSLVPPTGANQVTGGDIHPGGAGVLLRTYSHVFFYALGKADLATALAGEPRVLPAAVEAQGEAVAWTAAGDGYLTVSEGAGSALHRSHCRAE
ncbi:MAG: hypothetical protein DRI90_27490 [Deltaproteobacteria bacterium]|nr:MAG: hypothetical protein DRI90_27490 [Deltaproteobacteria bacterium]